MNAALDCARLSQKDITDWGRFCAALQQADSQLHQLVQEVCSEDQRGKIAESCKGLAGASPLPPLKASLYRSQLVNTLNDLLVNGDLGPSAVAQSLQLAEHRPQEFRSEGTHVVQCRIAWANRVVLERVSGGHLPSRPDLVARVCTQGVQCLERPFRFWKWVIRRKARALELPLVVRAREIATAEQMRLIEELQARVEKRRALDREACFHRVAHAWLLVHGPAAWLLLPLTVLHIAMSIYYGGF